MKLSVEQVDVFSLVGSRFQALGAATEKALSPSLRFVHPEDAQVWHAFSRDLIVLPAHPRIHPLTESTIPAFASPAEAGTHLLTLEGWKAELALVNGLIL